MQDNSKYLAWSKYPKNETKRPYYLGNGFSKLLQMSDDETKAREPVSDGEKSSAVRRNRHYAEDVKNVVLTLPELGNKSDVLIDNQVERDETSNRPKMWMLKQIEDH